jgi:hypothetical protein
LVISAACFLQAGAGFETEGLVTLFQIHVGEFARSNKRMQIRM